MSGRPVRSSREDDGQGKYPGSPLFSVGAGDWPRDRRTVSEGRPGRPTSASRASLPQVRRSANRPTLSGPKGVRAATFAVLGLLVGVIAASAVASGVHAPTAMLAPSTSSIATWVGGPVASLVAGKNPLPPVVDPGNGEIYVTNFDVSNVTVISASAPSVIATIPTGTQPVSPTIDSINGAIYFPLEASSNLSVYSGKNDEFVTTIPVPAVPLPLTPCVRPSDRGPLRLERRHHDGRGRFRHVERGHRYDPPPR